PSNRVDELLPWNVVLTNKYASIRRSVDAYEHYNEWHPHSALGYRSPREYLRQRACNGLSDNRCLEI
ncbi:integrase core domain-containing protein, partial [Escherichia coli]|uniref:integrase core domain-containing protein n=1 Tax=Escherichia coli TaxID=562 RepID=UPI0039969754